LGEHIRVRADPVDAEPLAFELLDAGNLLLPTIAPVMRFLLWPIMTKFLAPPEIARMGANPPMIPTSTSPDKIEVVPSGPEAINTSFTSKPCFLKKPASLAIHMGAIETTGAV
jgi:hypothetical protein